MCVITVYDVLCCKGEKIKLALSSVMCGWSFVRVMLCVSLDYKADKTC